MGKRIGKRKVIEALHTTKGAVYLAAKRLDCSAKSVYNYINEYEDIAAIKNDYSEEVSDIAELKLREAVTSGDAWAIKYQLSTKGKDRGYVERQEVSGIDGEPIPIKMIEVVLPPEDGDATN